MRSDPPGDSRACRARGAACAGKTSRGQVLLGARICGSAAREEVPLSRPDYDTSERKDRRLGKILEETTARSRNTGVGRHCNRGSRIRRRAQTSGRPPTRVVRFVIATPDSVRPVDNFPWPAAISPDGSTVVYSAPGRIRERCCTPFAQISSRGGRFRERPALSSRSFHLMANGWHSNLGSSLRKVRLDGSAPITITSGAGGANGADWTTQDEIVLGAEGTKFGLSRVSAAGGDMVEFAKPVKSKGETHYLWPIALPDGKAVVFVVWSGSLATARLASVSIDGGDVAYLGIKAVRPLAIIDGKLIYVQADGAVMAVGIDGGGRKLSDRPVAVLDPVTVVPGNNGNAGIFVSAGGALVTSRGGTRSQMAWISRDGTATPITKEARAYSSPRIAPDGRRIAMIAGEQDKRDIWTYDLETGTFSKLTSIAAVAAPEWSPDGSKIFFVGLGDTERFAIWSQRADGGAPAEKVLSVNGLLNGLAIAPDGRSLLYMVYNNNTWDQFRLQLDSTHVAVPWLATSADESGARFSPDGQSVLLVSDRIGPTGGLHPVVSQSGNAGADIDRRRTRGRMVCRWHPCLLSRAGAYCDVGEALDVAERARDCSRHRAHRNFYSGRRSKLHGVRRREGWTIPWLRVKEGRLPARRRAQLARGAGAKACGARPSTR